MNLSFCVLNSVSADMHIGYAKALMFYIYDTNHQSQPSISSISYHLLPTSLNKNQRKSRRKLNHKMTDNLTTF